MEEVRSDVELNVTKATEEQIEAAVTTEYGVANVTLDLSKDGVVGVEIILPSGNLYDTSIHNYGTGMSNRDIEDSLDEIFRLASASVVQSFQQELAEQN